VSGLVRSGPQGRAGFAFGQHIGALVGLRGAHRWARLLDSRQRRWLRFCHRFDVAPPPGFQLGALLRLAQMAGHEF